MSVSSKEPGRSRSEKLALWVAALAQVGRVILEAVRDGRPW
jgi:hypothetical protein